MSETFDEFRVKSRIDGQAQGVSEPTRDARAAGAIYRHNRDFLADAGLGGEVEIQKRTVRVGDWEPDKAERIEPRPQPREEPSCPRTRAI